MGEQTVSELELELLDGAAHRRESAGADQLELLKRALPAASLRGPAGELVSHGSTRARSIRGDHGRPAVPCASAAAGRRATSLGSNSAARPRFSRSANRIGQRRADAWQQRRAASASGRRLARVGR